jgi:hypothetical protein
MPDTHPLDPTRIPPPRTSMPPPPALPPPAGVPPGIDDSAAIADSGRSGFASSSERRGWRRGGWSGRGPQHTSQLEEEPWRSER